MTTDYFGQYDPDLDFERWYTVLTARRIERVLGKEDLVLELGSATGLLTQALARHKRRFVCVERSYDYVARAKARALPHTRLENSLIKNFCSDLSFDHVLAINVLHELADQASAIARIKTFMRPGTLLHVTLPNPASLHRASAFGSGMIANLSEQSERGRQFDTVRLQHADEVVSQMAGVQLVEVWREPVLAKPLPNKQMALLSDELIEAYDQLTYAIPEAAAMNYSSSGRQMSSSVTIIGSSVASLATALIAAQRGHRVNLYVDPLRIGGSFAGLKVGQRRLDLGCRLFELDYENSPAKSVETFDLAHDSHRPFIIEVAGFIKHVMQGDLQPACVPEMLIAGRRTRCVLMTTDLSDLPAALSEEDRRHVREQVQEILEFPAIPNNSHQTLDEASLAQHGRRLHELLVQAVCAKQHPAWDAVLASYRRKLWVTVFQPQTILEAFSGGPIGFQPHRPFSTTRIGSLYPLVGRLYQAVRECEQIVVIPAGPLHRLSCQRSGQV